MKKLYEYSKNVFSQNGEDGIVKYIFEVLNINEGIILEIGAWDGFHFSNIANLWSNDTNFKAILIESTDRLKNANLTHDNIDCFTEMVSSSNTLEKMLDTCKWEVTKDNFVLASIDIDGDDLAVTKSLGKYRPMILIVEFNGDIKERVNPGGHTLEEFITISYEMGYEFIGTSGFSNKQGGNAFFVRKDLSEKFPATKLEWDKRGILLSEGVIYS